jgi:hypothetical protein
MSQQDAARISPVFLGGPPKSGTTLLAALLDNHPSLLVYPEESRIVDYICDTPIKRWLRPRDAVWMLKYGGLSNFSIETAVWKSGPRDYRHIDFAALSDRYIDLWNRSQRRPADLLECAVYAYGEITNQIENRRYWIEKTPFNEARAAKLARYWPDLKVISILRDPRDNYVSHRKHRLTKRQNRELNALTFITQWANALANCLEFRARGGKCLLIRYETLVEQPRQTMTAISSFLGIPFDECLLMPTKGGASWSGNSVHSSDARNEISNASVGIYRKLLSEELQEAFMRTLGPALPGFGWWDELPARMPTELPAALTGTGRERWRARAALRRLNAVVEKYPDKAREDMEMPNRSIARASVR